MKDAVAIIGTRHPSLLQQQLAGAAAKRFSQMGYKIKTGAAGGIDLCAMINSSPKQLYVYLPWADYNAQTIPAGANIVVYDENRHKAWLDSVFKYHPNPALLTAGAIKLHARNFGIVDETALVCAFPQAGGGGGTGQGIRIAQAIGIPVVTVEPAEVITRDQFFDRCLRFLLDGVAAK